MRVIKFGILPENKLYQGKCTNCKTEVEFSKQEAMLDMDRQEHLLRVECPLCKNGIFVSM